MAITQEVTEVGATLSVPAIIAILEGVVLFIIVVMWLFRQRASGRGRGNRNEGQYNNAGWYR